jgi:hypothetical protein
LKKILVERRDLFARMLTERLLAYACGRRMEALDQPEIARLTGELKKRDYGMRTLVEQVVLSGSFQSR